MKRLAILIPVFLVISLFAPYAQATCSGYHCRLGSCPWYQLLIDESFNQPSCGAWTYTAGASASSGPMCSWTSQPYAQIVYLGGFQHTGTVYQTVNTLNDATALDDFSFSYIVETDGLQPGDQIKAQIIDLTTGTTTTTDTFGSEMWCNSVSHAWNSAGWKGHQLKIKFSATLSDPSTVVKITGVDLWQHVTN